jgi:hypothetical protein
MTREQKCELAIERGYTYEPETGLIYSRYGKTSKPLNHGYISIGLELNEKTYRIQGHQFAWYWINKECVDEIDHINGIKTDNRICNLRSVTHQQNQWNRNTAKGYYFDKNANKYRAEIRLNNKNIYLGLYHSEEEARNAYLQAKEIYHKI